MQKFLLLSLFALAGAGVVLAQNSTDVVIPKPFDIRYVRLQPQPINTLNPTVSLDTDPILKPDSTPNHGQSIVGNPGGLPNVLSVPNFTRSFTAYGTTWPYTIMGNEPSLGHTTSVPVNIAAVSIQLLTRGGSIFTTVPAQQYFNLTLNSPNFVDADYADGHGQFADAVQRAEFYNSMKQDWHTQLQPVRIVDQVTIQVPATVDVTIGGTTFTIPTYQVDSSPDGDMVILMLDLYFDEVVLPSVFNNEVNAGNFTTDAINMLFLPNTYLFQIDSSGVPSGCCILGFHTYFSNAGANPEPRWTAIFASWIVPGYFAFGFSDVTALSHEISETLNDPFINNLVPSWQYPDQPSQCQNNLETGDPIEGQFGATFPMPMKAQSLDFTYHPQNEALLQWFEQIDTSDAYDGAYSYPSEVALTAPATPCP